MSNYFLGIGINYSGSQNALRGCINDAHNWAAFFAPIIQDGARLLTEQSATKAGMVAEISKLLAKLQPGDTAIITYSGHGTYIPDQSGDEDDRRDEALCPFDLTRNLLLDDELQMILAERIEGSKVLLITDCCHSGTMTRSPTLIVDSPVPYDVPRYVDFASLSTCMCNSTLNRIKSQARAARSLTKAETHGIIHLAGCRDTEVSYDATIGGQACGAFTYYALAALRTWQAKGLTFSEWRDAVTPLRLPSRQYPQTPVFNGPLSLIVPGFEVIAPPIPATSVVGTLTIGGQVYDVTLRK